MIERGHIKVDVIKVKDMFGKRVKGYRAQFEDIDTGTKESPYLALDALDRELHYRAKYETLNPYTGWFHGLGLVVWYNGAWAYCIIGEGIHGSTCMGFDSLGKALGAGRDHVAQYLMDRKVARELAREVSDDKSLFDSLFPVAA